MLSIWPSLYKWNAIENATQEPRPTAPARTMGGKMRVMIMKNLLWQLKGFNKTSKKKKAFPMPPPPPNRKLTMCFVRWSTQQNKALNLQIKDKLVIKVMEQQRE